MWTASIIEKLIDNGKLMVKVRFTDGVDIATENYNFESIADIEQLKSRVRNKIQSIIALRDLASKITDGNMDVNPTIASVKTQEQIDKEEWIVLWQRWVRTRRLIEAQILTGAELGVITLQNNVKAGFKPSYVDII